MPTSQIMLMAIFGIALIAWGAWRDLKNHKKEKAARQVQGNTGA